MPVTMDDLKIKYPQHTKMKYDPKSNCRHCHGSGERKTANKDIPYTVCMCVYVDHSVAEDMQDKLTQVAREVLKEFRDTK